MFSFESFMLGVLLCLIILFPFTIFRFDEKQSKITIVLYSIISWGLLFLLLYFYHKFSLYYMLERLSGLGVIDDSNIEQKKTLASLMFNLSGRVVFFINVSIVFLGWLYSLVYYLILKYFYSLKIISKIKVMIWGKK